jgi:hypothetical protein
VQVHRHLPGDRSLDSLAVPDVYFSAAYGEADEEMLPNGTWQLLEAYDGGWLLPVVTRSSAGLVDGTSPYGYAGVYADEALGQLDQRRAWDAALERLRDEGVVSLFVRRSPLVEQAAPPADATWIVRDHPTRAIVLGPDDAAVLATMEGRSRTSIRKAVGMGLEADVRPAVVADLHADAPFRVLYEEAMQRRGAAPRYFFPDTYYQRLLFGLGEQLLIGSVSDGSSVVASSLFLRHGDLLHYHLSGSRPEAGRAGATNLLIWEAARWGCANGVRVLHLGGGVDADDSLYRFKRQFGGIELSYSAYGVVVNAPVFERASADRAATTGMSTAELAALGFPAYRQADAG